MTGASYRPRTSAKQLLTRKAGRSDANRAAPSAAAAQPEKSCLEAKRLPPAWVAATVAVGWAMRVRLNGEHALEAEFEGRRGPRTRWRSIPRPECTRIAQRLALCEQCQAQRGISGGLKPGAGSLGSKLTGRLAKDDELRLRGRCRSDFSGIASRSTATSSGQVVDTRCAPPPLPLPAAYSQRSGRATCDLTRDSAETYSLSRGGAIDAHKVLWGRCLSVGG